MRRLGEEPALGGGIVEVRAGAVYLAISGYGDIRCVGGGDKTLSATLRRNVLKSGIAEIVIVLGLRAALYHRPPANMQFHCF